MGVSTVAFVTAKPEKILDLMPKLIKDLNKWQRQELDEYWDKKGFHNRLIFLMRDKLLNINKDLKDFSNGVSSVTTSDFGGFYVNFTVYGETRSLFITHTCSNDYSEYHNGDKIIFSLGQWGLSVEIMKVIIESVKEFGDVYFAENDCSDEFKLINNETN